VWGITYWGAFLCVFVSDLCLYFLQVHPYLKWSVFEDSSAEFSRVLPHTWHNATLTCMQCYMCIYRERASLLLLACVHYQNNWKRTEHSVPNFSDHPKQWPFQNSEREVTLYRANGAEKAGAALAPYVFIHYAIKIPGLWAREGKHAWLHPSCSAHFRSPYCLCEAKDGGVVRERGSGLSVTMTFRLTV